MLHEFPALAQTQQDAEQDQPGEHLLRRLARWPLRLDPLGLIDLVGGGQVGHLVSQVGRRDPVGAGDRRRLQAHGLERHRRRVSKVEGFEEEFGAEPPTAATRLTR